MYRFLPSQVHRANAILNVKSCFSSDRNSSYRNLRPPLGTSLDSFTFVLCQLYILLTLSWRCLRGCRYVLNMATERQAKASLFDELPTEIILTILDFMWPPDYSGFTCTCRHALELVNSRYDCSTFRDSTVSLTGAWLCSMREAQKEYEAKVDENGVCYMVHDDDDPGFLDYQSHMPMFTTFCSLSRGQAPRMFDGGLFSMCREYGMRRVLIACPSHTIHLGSQLPQPQTTCTICSVDVQGRWPELVPWKFDHCDPQTYLSTTLVSALHQFCHVQRPVYHHFTGWANYKILVKRVVKHSLTC